MNTSLEGIGAQFVTFEVYGTVADGAICKFKRNHSICKANSADDFIGVVDHQKNGYACVQIKGFVRVPCADDDISLGWQPLVADGNGGVAVAESGRETLVMELDEDNGLVGLYL